MLTVAPAFWVTLRTPTVEILLLAECGRKGPGVRLSFWGLMGVGSAFSSRAASPALAFRGDDMRSDLPEERLNALRRPMPNVYMYCTNSQQRRQTRSGHQRSECMNTAQASTFGIRIGVSAPSSPCLAGG